MTPLPSPRAAQARLQSSSLRSNLWPGTTVEDRERPVLGRLSTALTTLHRQAMKSSWSPGPGDVQMMSSLFVKVDCGWEEAAEGTAYQPHRAQARPQSTFTVHKQASAMYRSKVPRWAAARTQTLAKRTSPTHVPLHPSSPLGSSHPFVSYLACTVPAQENLSLTS